MKVAHYPKKGSQGFQVTHGKTGAKVYHVWNDMNLRCKNMKHPGYKHYGGRGIKVLWGSFEEFYQDMGDPPEGMCIERIDNAGDYCKANCKWASYFEQGRNKRNNRLITFDGQTKHMAEWARQLGIKHTTLHMRLGKYGWSLERAMTPCL